MKQQILHTTVAVVGLLCTLSAAVSAQRMAPAPVPMPPPPMEDPVQYARTAYRQAAHILKGTLPIYSGHDAKALDAAKRAEKAINDFVKERAGDFRSGAPDSGLAEPKGNRATAFQRVTIVISDAAQYTPQQIKVSLARLQFSQSLIRTATARLNAIQNMRSISLSEAILFGQMSAAEIDKAIQSVHSSK